MPSFRLADVVTAVRCARQLVLADQGHPIMPAGTASIGAAAHAVLSALADGASVDRRVLAALAERTPRLESVRDACYRLAYREAHRRGMQLASGVSGADLARLDRVTRSLCELMATLLVRARAGAEDAREAVARAMPGSEAELVVELDDLRVDGRADLLSRDVRTGLTWVWDFETQAGSEKARIEHVRLIAMACRARGVEAAAALLDATGQRVEVVKVPAVRTNDEPELRERLRKMLDWREAATPPQAEDPETCRECVAQGPCWARWGRTLAEAEPDAAEAEGSSPGVTAHSTAGPTDSVQRRRSAVPAARLDPAPLWLGEDVAASAPARIDVGDLSHHLSVFGATGSGKTWLGKCIMEEAALAGIPVLAIDVRGDLAQLASVRGHASGVMAARAEAMATRVETRIFTPGSDAGLRTALNPLRLRFPAQDDEARCLCMSAMAENLLGAIRIPDAWELVAKEYLAQLLAASKPGLSLAELVDLVRSPDALNVVPLLRSRTRRDTLAEQLRALSSGAQRFLYDKGRRLDMEALLTATDPGKTPVNVIWVGSVGDTAARERFVATVLADVVGWMVGVSTPTPRLLVVLDEVGPFVPPHGDPPAKGLLRRVLQEGRKYGVCGLFCTQNFTDVDYKLMSQAHTMALGKVGAPQDKARARKLLTQGLGFDATSAADELVTAPLGTFLVTKTAQSGTPRWVRLRPLLTEHAVPWGESDVMANTEPSLREAWRKGRSE